MPVLQLLGGIRGIVRVVSLPLSDSHFFDVEVAAPRRVQQPGNVGYSSYLGRFPATARLALF